MAVVISVANQKGGVGKTITSLSTAHALVKLDKRVLLVDCDPQGNASIILCERSPYDYPLNVADLITNEETSLSQCAFPSRIKGLDIVSSNIEIMDAVESVKGTPLAMIGIRSKLTAEVHERYDYIIIDTPPRLRGVMVNNALAASDWYVITNEAESYFALRGMQQLLKSAKNMKSLNPKLELLGVLITLADFRNKQAKGLVQAIQQHFGESNVFETIIPRNTAIAQATAKHKTILEFGPKESGAKAYRSFGKELIEWVARKS